MDIGAALAADGFGLSVYSSDPRFVEPFVVTGYLNGNPAAGEASIRFYHPANSPGSFAEEHQADKAKYFKRIPTPDDDWVNAFYSSLYKVDGVIILGGGNSSLVSAHICLGRGVPVLPIGAFGGAAHEVWKYLTRDTRLREESNADALANWKKGSASECAKTLRSWHDRVARKRDEYTEEQEALRVKADLWDKRENAEHDRRLNSLLALSLLVLFVLALMAGLLVTSIGAAFKGAFILGLLCAGASGSTARLLMPAAPTSSRLSTVVLGAVSGLVLSLFYLLPQFVNGGALTLDEWPLDKLWAARYQFISAMMFAFVAGVGFDLVADRFRKAAVENAEKVSFMPGATIQPTGQRPGK